MRKLLLLAVGLASLFAPKANGQAAATQFETLGVKPMAIARLGDHDFLLVCNTPDNSLLVYDTVDHGLVGRVRVGLRPVTVVWNPVLHMAFTCNYLGDSVSSVRFVQGANGSFRPVLNRTSWVGDEPTDLTFTPDNLSFFVTLNSRSAFGWYDSFGMAPIGGTFGLRINVTLPLFDPNAEKAIKNPRRIDFRGSMLTVLGQHGGNSSVYDFDMFTLDLSTGIQSEIGGLGSTNWNMTFADDGLLYTVGGLARNGIIGESSLRQASTGFVESRLFVVKGVGTGTENVQSRDLNRDENGAVVPKSQALAAPTDVEVYAPATARKKIFVTAFSSDRIGVLHDNGGPPLSWPMTYIDVKNPAGNSYSRSGPRALVLKTPADFRGDPGTQLYSFNALNHSISVIDPDSETEVARLRLPNDPTPDIVRTGREFLYSADLSGNGFVSCSSCHVDARTDTIMWDLGEPGGGPGPAVPQNLIDGVTGGGETQFFTNDKGPMVTQTLQGLVNFPVEGQSQYLFTNAPYHWRADRASFLAFNSAFVSLMGAPNIGADNDPQGITDTEMREFEAMINRVTYPPNPEQSIRRRYTGDFGTADLEDGTGAARGMKLFHTRPFPGQVTAGRSCVGCHFLPEGSNNRITITGSSGGPDETPIETAATRMLFEREGRLETSTLGVSQTLTSEFGLVHTGAGAISINSFTFNTFFPFFPGGEIFKLADINAFLREFDSGVGPAIGAAWTVDALNVAAVTTDRAFALLEAQVLEANSGLAIVARLAGIDRGFTFDVSADPPSYRELGTGTLRSRDELLALMQRPRDILVLQATPLGEERRVASPTGNPPALLGPPPSDIELQPMMPNTAWEDVPAMTKNWIPGTGPNGFNFVGFRFGQPVPTPTSLETVRVYQHALSTLAPEYGLTALRHEAPRRFRVAGHDIRDGAKLVLLIPADPDVKPPYSNGEEVSSLIMNVFPTDERTSDGRPIWETAAEAEPLVAYGLMLGGPWAPGVVPAYEGQVAEPPPLGTFDPGWNQYHVTVWNTDGSHADGGWQSLTMQ